MLSPGDLVVTTLGQSNFWDFTDASKLADRQLGFEPDHRRPHDPGRLGQKRSGSGRCRLPGCNYLDLRGKSTVKEGEAPTQRAVQFSVVGEGVIAIDCYANGTGRNFYAYVDAAGQGFRAFRGSDSGQPRQGLHSLPGHPGFGGRRFRSGPTLPSTTFTASAGTRAPRLRGRTPTPLAAPAVTASPAEVTKGDNTPVDLSHGPRLPDARDLYLPSCPDEARPARPKRSSAYSETVSAATEMTVPAETVAELKPGSYTISVTAAAAFPTSSTSRRPPAAPC